MRKLFIVLAVIALASCQKEEAIQLEEQVPVEESQTIPIEVALENLQTLRSELYPETKSSLDDIYSIDVFGKHETKSAGSSVPDTLLYLVNFQDEGFAILAGQTKLTSSVFCLTDDGTLSFSQMEEAMDMLNSLSTKSVSENEEGEEDEDFEDIGELTVPMIILSSALNQMEMTPEELYDEEIDTKATTYRDVTKKGPFLKTKWHQNSPFNDFRSDNSPAGCVAIATGQIIVYNRTQNYNKKSFNLVLLESVCNYQHIFDKGTKLAQEEASEFLKYIGNKDNCNIKYGKDCSTGNSDGAKRTFKNFGYSKADKYLGFEKKDKERVIASLKKSRPVYMDGMYKLNTGHAWVIDGLYVRDVVDTKTNKVTKTENLFHINWGWQGSSDGYYVQGVFDTSKRVGTDSVVDDGGSTSKVEFTWNYRTILCD